MARKQAAAAEEIGPAKAARAELSGQQKREAPYSRSCCSGRGSLGREEKKRFTGVGNGGSRYARQAGEVNTLCGLFRTLARPVGFRARDGSR